MKTNVSASAVRTLVAGLIAASACAAQAQTYFDGVFNDPDWTLTTITNAGGAGSSVQAFQMPFGGNGGTYRIIRNNLSVSAIDSRVFGVHMNVNAFYNPSTQGAVTSINYSEDSKNFLNQGGNGQGSGLAIIQSGNIYILRNPILVMPFSGYSNWAPNSAPGIVASDLWLLDNAGNVFAGQNPDFSASGGVMQFGFWRGNSSGTISSGTFNTECGIDNWHVQVVPAPGAAALLGIAGLLGARRRR